MKYSEIKEGVTALRDYQFRQSALGHALSVLNYDGETVAPKDSVDERVRTMNYLSELSYKMATDPGFFELVYDLDERKDELDEEEKRMVSLIKKDCDQMTKIPMDEYLAFEELTNKANEVWKEAKRRSDFAMFAPYLEKIVESLKRRAAILKPEMAPYNALLDDFEKGLTVETLDPFFEGLRKGLVPVIEAVSGKPQEDDTFLKAKFPVDVQKALSWDIMKLMGLNTDRVVIGEVEHPFTDSFNICDVRITTHYYEDEMLSNVFSVLHEGGHAAYELGIDPRYSRTVLCDGASMSIHESQSRFYENIIGRSKAFSGPLFELCKKHFPGQFKGVSREMFWKAANKSQPSLIRIEADELTYSMHIMVRYEIEKLLMDGSLKVCDIPGVWNEMYTKYLGVRPENDSEGCLQDVHWAGGGLGYFPSYALGSAYGAQFLSFMEKDVPDLWERVAEGDLSKATGWLNEKIHRFGCLYTPGEILSRICGKFDSQYYIDYLTKKYTEVYSI